MTVGEVAGLLAAFAFVLLVGVSAVPLLKLGRLLDETRLVVRGVGDETVPLMREVTSTVGTTNAQLLRVDAITANVAEASTNAAALTSVVAATVGGPLVRVAAFSYGVRRALAGVRGRPAPGR